MCKYSIKLNCNNTIDMKTGLHVILYNQIGTYTKNKENSYFYKYNKF